MLFIPLGLFWQLERGLARQTRWRAQELEKEMVHSSRQHYVLFCRTKGALDGLPTIHKLQCYDEAHWANCVVWLGLLFCAFWTVLNHPDDLG